jgi:hypothetical protein
VKRKLNADVEVEMLDGAEAGKALGMMLAHRKYDAEPVAHQLEIRARILRDITPVVSISGPGLPAARGKNVEWAAGEMEAAAVIIRRLYNLVPRTALDLLHEEVAKAARRFVNAEAEGHAAVIEDAHFQLLRAVTTLNEATL